MNTRLSLAIFPASAFSALLSAIVFGIFLIFAPIPVHSQSSSNPLLGYAWSENVGWMDLNCQNQSGSNCSTWGILLGSNGALSGYAWSENIGWISANQSDLSGCPSAPCTATITNGRLTGWFKALSADNNGWDGWISLSGSNYGPIANNGTFSGYAWGSNVIGWLDFEYAHYAACAPTYSCSGNTIEYENSSCSTSAVTTCVSPQFCQAGSNSCLYPAISFNPAGNYTGNLQLIPNIVGAGESTKVYWNVSSAQNCTVTGSNGDSWTGLSSPTNGETSSPITAQTIYKLSCTAYGTNPSVAETESVNVAPSYEEI